MFNYLSAKKNKQKEQLRVPYQEYIYTAIEPSSSIFDTLPAKIETKLKGNIHDMRRDFRRMAKRIKGLHVR